MGLFYAQKVHQDRFWTETISKKTTIGDDDIDEEYQDIFGCQVNLQEKILMNHFPVFQKEKTMIGQSYVL